MSPYQRSITSLCLLACLADGGSVQLCVTKHAIVLGKGFVYPTSKNYWVIDGSPIVIAVKLSELSSQIGPNILAIKNHI